MWKAFAPLLLLVVATWTPPTAADDPKYTTKYDNVDLDEILNNERLFNKYADCLLDEGNERCTTDAKELKAILPEALQTNCAKCNEKQKERIDKVVKFMIDNRKDVWEKLRTKYDPDGTLYKKYEQHLKELA